MPLKPPTDTGTDLTTFTSIDTRLDLLELPINVKASPYNATGDGVTDDTTAVQAAITAGGANGVYFPRGTFLVSALVNARRIIGEGRGIAIIKAKSTVASGTFVGGWGSTTAGTGYLADITLDGNRAAGAVCSGIFSSSVTRMIVERVNFQNFANQAINLTGTTGLNTIHDCYVTNSGSSSQPVVAGGSYIDNLICDANGHNTNVAVVSLSSNSTLANSTITQASRSKNKGVECVDDCTITRCTIATPSSGNSTNRGTSINCTGNRLEASFNRINSALSSGIVIGATSTRCKIVENTIEAAVSDGIICGIAAATDTGTDNLVSGNVVKNVTGGDQTVGEEDIGIESQMARTVIIGNVVESVGGHGIWCNGRGSKIIGNSIKGHAQVRGFSLLGYRGGVSVANTDITVTGNTCSDGGSGTVHAAGIYINAQTGQFDVSSCIVEGNRCFDTRGGSALQDYGIYAEGAGAKNVTGLYIGFNDFSGNALGEFGFGSNVTSTTASIASAGTIVLPSATRDTITVSGTTTVTSVTATGWGGRRVTLVFSGALTFTDGSNLKLAGNFVTTADDTITLACDGTNWYEVGRSVN